MSMRLPSGNLIILGSSLANWSKGTALRSEILQMAHNRKVLLRSLLALGLVLFASNSARAGSVYAGVCHSEVAVRRGLATPAEEH
jgi:hypothetical protein